MEKNCKQCNKVFQKRYKSSCKQWNSQMFCSDFCSRKARNTKVEKECIRCGTIFKEKRGRVEQRKYCSQSCAKIGNTNVRDIRGEKNPNWKGGITPLKKKLRMSIKWRKWREVIFKRDGFICQECGQYSGYLEPHHIKPLRLDITRIFNINNGITLCRPCHIKTMGKETQFIGKYLSIIEGEC